MFRRAPFQRSSRIATPKINPGNRPYHQTVPNRFRSPIHIGATNHIVSIHNGTKSFDGINILDDLNFSIVRGDRLMLFGANGSGKSTLVKLLTGELELDSGSIKIKNGAKIAYLPQDIDDFTAKFDVQSLSDYLFKPFPELLTLTRQRSDLQLNIEASSDRTKKEDYQKKITMLTKEINKYGGYRIESILKGLQIFDLSLNQPFTQLSGGEKCRVALGGLLLQEPDLLILDEPTNHLDREGRKWLLKYLGHFNNAVLIITHDRQLMSMVGNRMLFLNAAKRVLEPFKGSYIDFLQKKQQDRLHEKNIIEEEQKEICTVKHEMTKLDKRRSNTNRYVINDVNKTNKLRKELKELTSQAHKCEDKTQKLFFNFVATQFKQNAKAVTVVNLSKRLSDLKTLKQVSFEIQFGERVVITGSNGSGKSTLLKILIGLETADSGRVNFDKEVNIGYMPQDYSDLIPTMTLIDAFSHNLNLSQTQCYRILKGAGFNSVEHFAILVSDLSVGQKRRLQFARLIGKGCNVLLLDEPTNHLDVLSMEQFESDLLNFPGTIIAVSHDETFIDKIATRVFNLYEGNLLEQTNKFQYR
jgi:ATP-binding cassette subfamily F protein 3